MLKTLLTTIFYFCNTHAGTSDRIKLVDSAENVLQEENNLNLFLSIKSWANMTKHVEHMALVITNFPTLNVQTILFVILVHHLQDVSKRWIAEWQRGWLRTCMLVLRRRSLFIRYDLPTKYFDTSLQMLKCINVKMCFNTTLNVTILNRWFHTTGMQ